MGWKMNNSWKCSWSNGNGRTGLKSRRRLAALRSGSGFYNASETVTICKWAMRLGPWCAAKRPCIRPSYRVWALTGLAHQLARRLACTLVRLEVRLWEFLIALQATQPFYLLWRIHHVGRGFHLRGPNTAALRWRIPGDFAKSTVERRNHHALLTHR